MKELQTINCLVCGKPAQSYSGHVHRGKAQLTAGFCKQHPRGRRKFSYRPIPDCEGCYGKYKEAFGLMRENVR